MPQIKHIQTGKTYEVADWQIELVEGNPDWEVVKVKPVKPVKDIAPEITPESSEPPA